MHERATTGRGSPLWIHERSLLPIGAFTSVALMVRAGLSQWVAWLVAALTLSLAAAVTGLRRLPDDRAQKTRLVAAYIFAIAFYFIVGHIVIALQLRTHDDLLRACDEYLFGVLPALAIQHGESPWLSDVASLGYMSYYVYLHLALVCSLMTPPGQALRYFGPVGLAFAIGFAGYLAVPAVGPGLAFPELFGTPVPNGPVGCFNHWLVTTGSSVYDVFPSVHVLVTGVLLREDWRTRRRRFWWMVGPAAALVFSTIYLRYHYAVDVLAALALIEPVWRAGRWQPRESSRHNSLPHRERT